MSITEATLASRVPPTCFSLPEIDEAIPPQLGFGVRRAITLSRFASAAVFEGIPLPEGTFSTIEEVVQAQWAQHTLRIHGHHGFQGLAGGLEIHVTDSRLEVIINAEPNLNVYQLKPVVQALEKMQPGLGWFVSEVLGKASCFGHEIYDMGFAAYMLDSMYWNLEEFNDESYARAMLMEEGGYVPKGPIDAETLERLRGEYGYWPSDVLEEAGGHVHLLRLTDGLRTRPKSLKPAGVRRWLKENSSHRLAGAVASASTLHQEFARGDRAFVWNSSEDDTDTLGALCFLTWDRPQLLLEAVRHHEENALNGGQAVEAFARCQLPLDTQGTDKDLRQLARATLRYLNRWALLAKLLSHFPMWEDDDEV
jgi:PRTRC genetic system protein F